MTIEVPEVPLNSIDIKSKRKRLEGLLEQRNIIKQKILAYEQASELDRFTLEGGLFAFKQKISSDENFPGSVKWLHEMGSYLESIETQTKSFSTEPCYCRQKISLEDIILQVVSAQLIDESEIASLLLLYCLNLLTANEGNEEAISQIQTLMTEIGHKFGIGSKQA